jgi:hypothetical protein
VLIGINEADDNRKLAATLNQMSSTHVASAKESSFASELPAAMGGDAMNRLSHRNPWR